MDEKSQNTSHIEQHAGGMETERNNGALSAHELAELKLAEKKLKEPDADNTKLATFISNNVDYSGATKKIDPVEIRLVRKLDMWIMPMLWIMYWLNYLDRNAIATAKLNDIDIDLDLSDTQYLSCVSILFVGYILGQIPSNMLITRVRPSWYMGGAMALWAIVSACSAASHNYIGFLLTRFFLGIVEAPYYPGALYILSSFYTRKEIATRISVLYTGNILATAFAGLIAAGIFSGLDDVAGLHGWQWLFILQGAITFVVAVLAIFVLPDEPLNTRWLTPDERELAHARILADTVGARHQTTSLQGLIEAAKDPKIWLFAFMQHMHLASNGFKNFFPTVVETLGFGTTITLVLTCPPYLISGVLSILWAMSSGKFNERTWHITISKSVAVVGFVLSCATLNIGAKYFAMCLFAAGVYCTNSIILGWVSATCSQTREKRACSLAIVNAFANAAFIWTPYLWPDSDAPRFVTAMSASAAFSLACVAGAWGMRTWLKKLNRKIRQTDDETVLRYAY